MADDEIFNVLKKQLDAKMGSYFEAQQRGVIAFANYLADKVRQEAPSRTGLLSEQIDWGFSSVLGEERVGYRKTTGVSGKNMYTRIRNAKGQFAKQETMSIEVGAINPTGWAFDFPVPYAGALDKGATVRSGSDAGLPVPRKRSGTSLAIPTPSPLGMSSGIYGRQTQRGVNVYAEDVINNPQAFGLRSVFKSKSGRALLGNPITKDAPDAKVNWFNRVIFALVDEFKVEGTEYITGTIQREKVSAMGKLSAELARWEGAS